MSIPERLICECGCTFKNKAYLQVHLRTEKHQFMMDNGGDLRAWQWMLARRGMITGLQNTLLKHDEGTGEWKEAKRWIDIVQADGSLPYISARDVPTYTHSEPSIEHEADAIDNPSVECECGCKVSRRCLPKHQLSAKHHHHMEMKEQGLQPKTGEERRKETYRRYVEKNREKIAERMKTYREGHYDHLLEHNREYKRSNREKIMEQRKSYRSKRITCECGCYVVRHDLSKHLQTLKHMQLLDQREGGKRETIPEPNAALYSKNEPEP